MAIKAGGAELTKFAFDEPRARLVFGVAFCNRWSSFVPFAITLSLFALALSFLESKSRCCNLGGARRICLVALSLLFAVIVFAL